MRKPSLVVPPSRELARAELTVVSGGTPADGAAVEAPRDQLSGIHRGRRLHQPIP
jgi:hypothetical protein